MEKNKIVLLGSTLIAVVGDASYVKHGASAEDYAKAMGLLEGGDEEALIALLNPSLISEKRRKEAIEALITAEQGRFTLKEGAVYFKEIPELSIPNALWEEIVKKASLRENYEDLLNFWRWCSLNPNPESRESLFTFLEGHGMHITADGMFLAYRNAWKVQGQSTVKARSIATLYFRLKGLGKNPKKYAVIKDDDKDDENASAYSYLKVGKKLPVGNTLVLGNLKTLFFALKERGEMHHYTDNHTRKQKYSIGVEARMPRSAGNQSNQISCSTGYHVCSKEYNYGSFGDTHLLCAVNPRDVLAVPEDSKLRTCAFTIVAELQGNSDNVLETNPKVAKYIEEHSKQQLADLMELLKENTPYELKINNILSEAASYARMTMAQAVKVRSERVLDL